MISKSLTAGILVVFVTAEFALAQPGRKLQDPNDPTKSRAVVTHAEREQLGLKPKSWEGVVHSDVHVSLNRLKETVERLKKENTGEAIRTLDAVEFPEAVYVQIRLKDKPDGKDLEKDPSALREAQRRVLRQLTAAEFHVRHLFDGAPGIVGYVNRSGLEKLAALPDVLGICVDDQPMPEAPRMLNKNDIPEPKSGEFGDEAGLKAGRVDARVYEGLKGNERVFVLVSLAPSSGPLPTLTDRPKEQNQRWQERAAAVRSLQDRALAVLSADDFWLWTRLGGSSGFAGYIDRDGLEKLWKRPEVTAIGLQGTKKTNWIKPRERTP